jgi:3-phenylpropionate/trans-cinnamate dioxygenase ferredoxin subunit
VRYTIASTSPWVAVPCPPVSETVALCAPDELTPGEARRFDVAGRRIALVRIGDEFYAVDDECSHEDYSLSEGEVWAEDRQIECPRHGSTFDLVTGEACSLPATRPVAVYEVEVENGTVAVVLP